MSKKQQQETDKFSEALLKFDGFGISPKLFIDQQTKYKSKFGSTLSLLLFTLVIVACWIYGKDFYYKENPNSIQTEEGVVHQEKFIIKKDTMNFCFGLQDKNWQHFIDPSIYTLKLQEYKQIQVINNGQQEIKTIMKDLKPRKCRKSDFGIAKEYFTSLAWLETLYCMDVEQTEIEGDYGQEIFTAIQGIVEPCNSSTSPVECKSQEEIDNVLKDHWWALYTTDTVINPKNYENPYQPQGRNVYGMGSNKMFKQIDFNYRNVYMNDNIGWLVENWQYSRGLQYSNEKEFIKTEPMEDGTFLQFLIRFEKVKQTRYYRTYLNLAEVLANVGGVLKVLSMTFLILVSIVTEKYYNVNVANSVFNFDYDYDGKIVSKGHEDKNKNKLHFNSFLAFFTGLCSKKEEKAQKKLLDYSVRKLSYHLDIKQLLQKMVEIDKLKMLLLNEEQIQLFEYLPKPVISEDVIQKQDKKKVIKMRDSYRLEHRHVNLLQEDIRNGEQKEEDAYLAFQLIKSKNGKGKINSRIIEIMDNNLRKNFEKRLKEENGSVSFMEKQSSAISEKNAGQQKNSKNSPGDDYRNANFQDQGFSQIMDEFENEGISVDQTAIQEQMSSNSIKKNGHIEFAYNLDSMSTRIISPSKSRISMPDERIKHRKNSYRTTPLSAQKQGSVYSSQKKDNNQLSVNQSTQSQQQASQDIENQSSISSITVNRNHYLLQKNYSYEQLQSQNNSLNVSMNQPSESRLKLETIDEHGSRNKIYSNNDFNIEIQDYQDCQNLQIQKDQENNENNNNNSEINKQQEIKELQQKEQNQQQNQEEQNDNLDSN